jgi:hypothetical protein
MKSNVHFWPVRLAEINRIVRDWVGKNYKTSAYHQVIRAIDDFSPEDIKGFIKLLAEDAVVGARLLQHLSKKR